MQGLEMHVESRIPGRRKSGESIEVQQVLIAKRSARRFYRSRGCRGRLSSVF
jgi:hypothetical protein